MAEKILTNLSPAMRQYFDAKAQYPGAVLFFRMGDFYELFFEDAEMVAPLLELTLTSRQKHGDNPIPMCGVPHHAGDRYMARLAEMGYRVAVCEQTEPADKAKGLVSREVTWNFSPGVIISQEGQLGGQSRFVAAVHLLAEGGKWGLAGLEVSTGDLFLGQYDTFEALRSAIVSFDPSECLTAENPPPEIMTLVQEMNLYATTRPEGSFSPLMARHNFQNTFGAAQVENWELDGKTAALAVGGAVLEYAFQNCRGLLKHLAPPTFLWQTSYLSLDETAVRNLELVKSLRDGGVSGTLLSLLDKTGTAMGARLLRQWLIRPLYDKTDISRRHGAVEFFLRDPFCRDEAARILKNGADIERAVGRLVLGRGSPRDLAAVRETLGLLPKLKTVLSGAASDLLAGLGEAIDPMPALYDLLVKTLVDNPPATVKDGGLIKQGVDERLDELLDLEHGGKNRIAALENKEKERTGINALKIGFNRVFGYYIEVTKANIAAVPPEWIRKQTIANGERYVTEELKDWEEKILSAGEKRLVLEMEIFERLKAEISDQARLLKRNAQIMAEVDVLAALAVCAEKYNWVRPVLTDEDVIDIKGGRHPVVESYLPTGEKFVANDVRLSPKEKFLIITGPNMAGKSTVLRQTALIVLLNQVGSFVPAEEARLSLRDRIFTRVGAADDLTRGRSTFMVEMSEAARILTQATPRSLVILDEVGRGTSTYDGLSLAWAISEYLHDLGGHGVPTLFATHYHELVKLAETKPHVKNFNVAVKNVSGRIVFLRKLMPGGASRSYGLSVAALAGLPPEVIARAEEVLADLSRAGEHLIRPGIRQLDLFGEAEQTMYEAAPESGAWLTQELETLDIDQMTPLSALNYLTELRERIKNGDGAKRPDKLC